MAQNNKLKNQFVSKQLATPTDLKAEGAAKIVWIDLATGRAVVDGGPAGVNQSGGRVTGHFTVPKRNGN